MVIRIKKEDAVLHEWTGVVPQPSDIPAAVHSQLEYLLGRAGDQAGVKLVITTDRYGA
jgi:hypothetical protein